MAQASQKVVEMVVQVVSSTDAPVTGDFLARRLHLHKTTVTAAANEAVRRGLLNRTKLDTPSRGQRPWGYTQLLDGDVVDSTVFEKQTRRRRDKKLKRGFADKAVASVVATYKAGPGGRGFTVREVHTKVGINSTTYETVRKIVARLAKDGVIENTGRHRKGAIVYRPVAEKKGKKPAEPAPDFPSLPKPTLPKDPVIAEPDFPPPPPESEPTTPTSIESLVVERADLRQQVKAAEKRINEIEREFARVRSLLG